MEEKKEKLISIDELIARAKNFGVDFGRGDPKNRLRYFVKIGILPHAERKTYNGLPSQGVYPESVLKTLIEIDKKLKEGKSILQIKREFEKEKKEKFLERPSIVSEKIFIQKEKTKFFKKIFNFYSLSKIFFLILIFSFFTFLFIKREIDFKKSLNMFLATITNFGKIAQAPTIPGENEEFLKQFSLEPYLTINAETIINPKLKVSQSITSPLYIIEKEKFLATISTSELTSDRTYTFPDQSGIVCLSTGNCIGLAGEITTPGGTANRLAKFIGPRRISNSSIVDLFAGVSITIDALGNVGIGTTIPRTKLEVAGNLLTTGRIGIGIENPLYPLHVLGQIRASGDICTDLGGGKCLSQISLTPPIFGGGGGIGGSGTEGYLPLWISATTLGNSILYQTAGKIGINLTNPNEVLTVGGVLSLVKTPEPEISAGFGKIFVGVDGKLYYKDDSGNVYDLITIGGVSGQGSSGQVVFWNSTSTISGNDELFWDINSRKLGIGTNAPTEKLEVVGTIKMTGFQLTTGAQAGYILTSDAFGFGTWQPAPTGTLPAGIAGQTLRHDGTSWIANNFLYNSGSEIGIGTTTPIATLAVAGSGYFQGPLTISTSSLAQLVLQFDSDNYLKFSITSTSSEILASKTLIFNSLTGELKFFDTSLKKGDKILRASIPIFKFPVAAETSSTTFVAITKEISPSNLNSVLPSEFPGSQRKFAFLINFADNIPQTASSSWQVDFQNQSDIDFEFEGQNLSNLDEGVVHLKDDITGLLDDNWILKAKVPNSNYKIRVFSIFLLVYDQIQ